MFDHIWVFCSLNHLFPNMSIKHVSNLPKGTKNGNKQQRSKKNPCLSRKQKEPTHSKGTTYNLNVIKNVPKAL